MTAKDQLDAFADATRAMRARKAALCDACYDRLGRDWRRDWLSYEELQMAAEAPASIVEDCVTDEGETMSDYEAMNEITKDEFDRIVDWRVDPVVETGGNACGYKEVGYRPNRRACGIRKDDSFVWAWVTGPKVNQPIKYRKKPVEIQAWRVRNVVELTIPVPIQAAIARGDVAIGPVGLSIKTLEGTMTAGLDDWIIQGVSGELYPCKPDIFAATYERNDRDE